MSTIRNFEEIQAWQEARTLANIVHRLLKLQPFRSDFDLRSQLRRAAGSVMHNIAEGFDSGTKKEFIRFLRYARRSAGEVQSQLYIALDQQYISHLQFEECYSKATRIKKQINAFITYLKTAK